MNFKKSYLNWTSSKIFSKTENYIMKKHLIAAAALATLSTAAFAQSATVYGIIDQSVWHVNNVEATAGTPTSVQKTKNSMESGVWLPSLFGITGSEDLGGGLKATFKLESNLNTDTGVQTTGTLFDRQSWVGLSGGFGELRAGNQIDALFLQSFVNNVRLAHSNSAAVIGALAASGNASSTQSGGLQSGTVFTKNTLTYITPSFNGAKLTYQRSMGEVAGSNKANSSDAFLLNYDGIQNLSLSAGTKSTKGSTADTSGTFLTQNLLGAVYKYGSFQFNVQTNNYKWKQSVASSGSYDGVDAGDKFKLNEVGVAYNVSPSLVAAVNYVDFKATDVSGASAKAHVTSVSLKYALSKRTSVWTMASTQSKVKNSDGAAATDVGTLPATPYYLTTADGNPNKSVTGYGVGITHTF